MEENILRKILIKKELDDEIVAEFPIDNSAIEQAAKIEIELHNRDNVDDLWKMEILEEEEN